MLEPGLYEQVINKRIKQDLSEKEDSYFSAEKLDEAEAANILTQYVSSVVKKSMDTLSEGKDNVNSQVILANKIISLLKDNVADESYNDFVVDQKAEQLLALLADDDVDVAASNKKAKNIVRPETSMISSSLFTGASHEPQMYSELKKEIFTADRIDMLVSFIKWSGLRLIKDELLEFTQRGGSLRIITTSYMGATDVKAIEELSKLTNTEIKISYDTTTTRLHAKAYVFYRNTGFTTAYVGSSNLSNAAISSGLEWNLKITAQDQRHTINKINATIESYWNSEEFEVYTSEDRDRLAKALRAEKYHEGKGEKRFVFDIIPYAFQQVILDKLQAEREIRGFYRNLVVAATGCGKTVISAFDYANFCRKNSGKKNRLLFVAHREEIIRQSMETFQGVLQDPNFGELFYKDSHPEDKNYLFASISSINSQNLCDNLPADYYDFIIIDEFHHAAAPSYKKILEHFKPKILLGLTATPERMDGKDIMPYFYNRIAAEIRLPEAINRKLLCPFQYFGISDTVDLQDVKWTRGGYDRTALSNVYSMNRIVAEKRANHIIQSLYKYTTNIDTVKGLGFCVSVAHADFMADYFTSRGIPCMALHGDSSNEDRHKVKQQLISGEIKVIFVVDIYNEGVDIKEVNTVLFLRPTESLTIFLQQLGRGLRISPEKECLTVLDFIGQANKKYDFESKFTALLDNTRQNLTREIKHGFTALPRGCYIKLEKKAERAILENIKKGFGTKQGLISKIQDFKEKYNKVPSLSEFLQEYHQAVETVYKNKYLFSRLCVEAGICDDFEEQLEEAFTGAFPRLANINSRRLLKFILECMDNLESIELAELDMSAKRLFNMFYVTVFSKTIKEWQSDDCRQFISHLRQSPIIVNELKDLLQYNLAKIDFMDIPVTVPFDCPLDVYSNYSRDQLLVALDYMDPTNVREGVKWLPDKQVDVLMVTLNKSDKDYSPTTMYEDYSINSKLFHWQSQSTTADTSNTGKRYINHSKLGSKVMLFVREFKQTSLGTAPYTFLGTVNYKYHQGSKPMSIVWEMDYPIPARYLQKTNKLVVG